MCEPIIHGQTGPHNYAALTAYAFGVDVLQTNNTRHEYSLHL